MARARKVDSPRKRKSKSPSIAIVARDMDEDDLPWFGGPPSGPPKAVALWKRLYQHASLLYNDEFHLHVPNQAIKTHWPGGTYKPCPERTKIPKPGQLVQLGHLLSVHVVNPKNGISRLRKGDENRPGVGHLPPFYWSVEQQACYCFDDVTVLASATPKQAEDDVAEASVKAYRKWHNFRDPDRIEYIGLPDSTTVKAVRLTVAIAYRSDKFSRRRGQYTDYLHHVDANVWTYTGKGVLMIQGGKLRLTPDGLVG